MDRPDLLRHVQDILEQERTTPEHWMYLSFATAEEGFKGGVYVKARGITHAILRCLALGINPGGQIFPLDIPDEMESKLPPEEFREKLLSQKDLIKLGGAIQRDGRPVYEQ